MSDADNPVPSERRSRARKRVVLKVRYRVVGATAVNAVTPGRANSVGHATRDLSLGGLFLACERPLPLGTEVELFLGEGEALRLEARVVRVVWGGRRGGRPIEPGMALSFATLSSEDEERLSRLLASV